jgi:hypothetical protein
VRNAGLLKRTICLRQTNEETMYAASRLQLVTVSSVNSAEKGTYFQTHDSLQCRGRNRPYSSIAQSTEKKET